MKDKSLEIMLMAVFGITGLTITMMAWLWPAMEAQRIMATLVGLVGILTAVYKYVGLRKLSRQGEERIAIRVEANEKQ